MDNQLPLTKKMVGAFIAVLFFISGGTGLIYQIVWFKYLSLFLGNSTHAQSVVLATFMGGLAIGASLWGRRADRSRQPLLLYGLLELGIAVYCLLYPSILSAVKNLFIGVVTSNNIPSDGNLVLMLKLLVCVATLIVPTILMGGTLPVLVRFLSERLEDSGKMVAKLYFLNSFGAVVGSALAGFFLVRIIGLTSTVYLTVIVNAIIGLLAMVLGRQRYEEKGALQATPAQAGAAYSPMQIRLAITVAGISGLAAMIYEVTWVRLLVPVLGSSTYSFSLMLVAFISGITLGSWLIERFINRMKNLFGFLAICQAGIAFSLLISLPLYGRLPYYFWHLGSILSRSNEAYPIFLLAEFFFCFAIMLIPTIFMGMTLPVTSQIASRTIEVLGKTVGNVFSINTIGTVIGSLLGGLVLIPAIGVKGAVEFGILLNVAAAILVLLKDPASAQVKRIVLAAGLIAVSLVSMLISPSWSKSVMLSGVFRNIVKSVPPPASYGSFLAQQEVQNIAFYKEGSTATVAVLENQYLNSSQHVLMVNGKADASSRADLPTQVLLGQLPLLFHPQAKEAFLIGLGSGVTAGSMLTHPLDRVDCAEISPEVIAASKFFNDVNNKPLENPRFHLYVDDALSFLKLTEKKYDVIVSEPTNPWIAGIGNLFTQEFFEKCSERLNRGGIMVQWFHLYEMDDETFRLALRTFQQNFRNVTIWQSWVMDVVMVGSDAPLPLDIPTLQSKMVLPDVRNDLLRIRLRLPAELLSLQIMPESQVSEYAGSAEINTEDLPLLEYWAPRAFFLNKGVHEFRDYDERINGTSGELLLQRYKALVGLSDAEKRTIGMLHASADGGNQVLAYTFLREYHQKYPGDAQVLEMLAKMSSSFGRREESLDALRKLVELEPSNPALLDRFAWMKFTSERMMNNAFVSSDLSQSINMLNRCTELVSDTVDRFHIELGDIYFSLHDYPKSIEHYKRALQLRERYASSPIASEDALLLKFAQSFYNTGNDTLAIGYATQALNFNPNNEEARHLISTSYARIAPGDSAVHEAMK